MKIDSEREKQDKMKAEQMERERRKQLEQEEKLAEMKAQAEKQMQLTPAKNLTQTHTGLIQIVFYKYKLFSRL